MPRSMGVQQVYERQTSDPFLMQWIMADMLMRSGQQEKKKKNISGNFRGTACGDALIDYSSR